MKFPPENFEILRQFLIQLRQGDIALDVGKKSLAALVQMVNDPDSVAVNNIVTLAQITHVSPASITRLAKLLGYNGFNQFQQVFKQRSKIPSNYYSQKVKNLVADKGRSKRSVFERQLKTTAENMQYAIDHLAVEALDRAVEILAWSSRIFVFGHKQSSAMANVMCYGLCLIRHNVQTLGQYEHGLALALGQLKRNDLVVVFSSSPYSNLSVDIASMARKKNCKLLVITDSLLSPLIDHASVSINIPTDGNYYTNSLSANCIFIEALLSLTAKELGDKAVNKLREHEKQVTELNANS